MKKLDIHVKLRKVSVSRILIKTNGIQLHLRSVKINKRQKASKRVSDIKFLFTNNFLSHEVTKDFHPLNQLLRIKKLIIF